MTDRDHFAAAALTGLLSNVQRYQNEPLTRQAFEIADFMLRERERTAQKVSESDSLRAVSPNHDAAPAARVDSRPLGNPVASAVTCTGKQPAPPCVETDGFSPGSRPGQINRTPERESPRRECGESQLRDVPQPDNGRAAGGPEHHISEAEIDALQHVIEEGQLVDLADYGRLRSLIVRLRPEWEGPNDPAEAIPTSPRNGALSGCGTVPDPDSRVWETPCTPQPHATPTQGSVQGEGSFRDSRFAKEPVAWAVAGDYGEYAVKLCFDEASAVLEADRRCRGGLRPYYVVVPLYRQPPDWAFLNDEIARLRDAIRRLAGQDATLSVCDGNVTVTMDATLTDAEREAVEEMLHLIATRQTDYQREAHTLRKLLERLA